MSVFGQAASLTAGGFTSLGGWNDQNCRPFSRSTAAVAAACVAGAPRGSGAPILTHSSKSAMTSSGSLAFGGIWSASSV